MDKILLCIYYTIHLTLVWFHLEIDFDQLFYYHIVEMIHLVLTNKLQKSSIAFICNIKPLFNTTDDNNNNNNEFVGSFIIYFG